MIATPPSIPLSETLARAGTLPPPLVSAAARARVMRACAAIPAELTSWGYLECRLGADDDRVDLITRVDRRASRLLPDRWSTPASLAREWRSAASPLHEAVRSLWLEFDLPAREEAPPGRPGLFVSLAREAQPRRASGPGAEGAPGPVEPFLAAAAGEGAGGATGRCRRALPGGAFVPYLGVFPHREGSPLRVCVAGLAEDALPAFLRRLGWGGWADLGARLGSIARSRAGVRAPGPLLLHLDFYGELGDRIGLEYVCAPGEQLTGQLAELRFLDHLVELGLCTPEKREALAAWPGFSRVRLPHEIWRSLLVRRLNHVKIQLSTTGAMSAKAYLSFHHRPHRHR